MAGQEAPELPNATRSPKAAQFGGCLLSCKVGCRVARSIEIGEVGEIGCWRGLKGRQSLNLKELSLGVGRTKMGMV